MNISKPNRMRAQSADFYESRQKASGDQHILPLDEPDETPHRPHSLNRQDMNKALPNRPMDMEGEG
jgi:hypothetical protein